MRSITKTFPGVKALQNVTLEVARGEIHAICGENGAGKSTLIKVLSGVYPAGSYEGEVRVGGRLSAFRSVADATRARIAVIHQELALVDQLTVAENIFLGAEPTRFGLVDGPELLRRGRALLAELCIELDPAAPVASLGVGRRQLVEI